MRAGETEFKMVKRRVAESAFRLDIRLRGEHLAKAKEEADGLSVREQIDRYIDGQSPAKSAELRTLHSRILEITPNTRLWFLDGKNSDGKVVSNPNIGYGSETLSSVNGTTRAFYKIGLSANTSGLSIYVMGLKDKKRLLEAYGPRIGRAKITGYCIKFRSLNDVDLGVIEEVVADAIRPKATDVSA